MTRFISKGLQSGGSAFIEPRPSFFSLEPREASILAQARSLIDWHARYRFCPACGSPQKTTESGYKKECDQEECIGHQGPQSFSYPRTDPVVITLVISPDGQKCLLGRAGRYVSGMYSCLAGFLEPGESMEEAARREVWEESNIKVGAIHYHTSQPWPFPSQLMYASDDKIHVPRLGCFGEALAEGPINLQDKVISSY